MTFFTRVMAVLIACEVVIIPALIGVFVKDVDPDSKALAIYVPLTPVICENCSPFDIVPSSENFKALAIWVPLTPSVYGDRSPFGDDLVPSTDISFLGRLVQFILGLNKIATSSWYDLLVDVGYFLGEIVANFLFLLVMKFLCYKLITFIWPPKYHVETTPRDVLTPDGSAALKPKPELVEEQQLIVSPINMENGVYQWKLDEFAETVRALMGFPADTQKFPKGFVNAVNFVRANKGNIEMQAAGLAYIRERMTLVKKSVKYLTAISDRKVSKKFSKMGGLLDKAEEALMKRCDIKRLTANIEFIYEKVAIDGIDERRKSQKYGSKVFTTARHISKFLKNKQTSLEDFLQEVSELCELYNDNLDRIMKTSNSQNAL